MNGALRSLASIGLRGSVMASKFVIVAFLAKHLEPDAFGIFGVLQGVIAIAVVALGVELYVAGNRDIIASNYDLSYIKTQNLCYLVHYVLAIPFLFYFYIDSAIPIETFVPFIFIFYLEHLVLEMFRLMVAWRRPLSANLMLFVQTASWVFVAVGAAYGFGVQFTLSQILWMWVGGEVVALLFAAVVLGPLVFVRAFLAARVDVRHARGLYVKAVPFLTAALSIALANNAPRLVLADTQGFEAVGVFTFHFSIAMALYTLSFTGVALIRYPGLIATYADKGYAALVGQWRRFAVEVAVTTLGMAAAVAVADRLLMAYVGRPGLGENVGAFYVMLGGMVMQSLSLAPHYFLFTLRRDRAIALAGPLALAATLPVLALALYGRFDIMTAASAIAVSGTTLFVVRSLLAWRAARAMRAAAT